jgi:hypothetical protein
MTSDLEKISDEATIASTWLHTVAARAIDLMIKIWNTFVVWFWKAVISIKGWSLTRKILVSIIALLLLLHFHKPAREEALGLVGPLPSMPMWATMQDVDNRVQSVRPDIVREVQASTPSRDEIAALKAEIETLQTERAALDARLTKLESAKPSKKRRR